MVLVSSEDVYVQKIEAEIRAYPKCRNLTEDKAYHIFLSMKVTQLLDIQPQYSVTSAQCTDFFFFSKIHCSTHSMNLNTQLEMRKRMANDVEGMMNSERPLQEMIVQQVKLIDKTLSGELTGTNIMPNETHIQTLSRYNSLPTTQANPLSSDSYNPYPKCLQNYYSEWCLSTNFHLEGHIIAQVLIGVDCARHLPVAVTDVRGFPI